MRKLQVTAIGEPADVLELVEFQAPAPGPGQVLVEVEAATINASDFLYITGQYFTTPQPPSDVGAEGVGRVLAVGPGEDESLVGARLLLLPTYRHGTWATHVIAAATVLHSALAIRGLTIGRWLTAVSPEQRASDVASAVAITTGIPHHFDVAATYPLDRIADAVRQVAQPGKVGTVVVKP